MCEANIERAFEYVLDLDGVTEFTGDKKRRALLLDRTLYMQLYFDCLNLI